MSTLYHTLSKLATIPLFVWRTTLLQLVCMGSRKKSFFLWQCHYGCGGEGRAIKEKKSLKINSFCPTAKCRLLLSWREGMRLRPLYHFSGEQLCRNMCGWEAIIILILLFWQTTLLQLLWIGSNNYNNSTFMENIFVATVVY